MIYKIIPVFITDWGCPNQCAFCNQKAITSTEGNIDAIQLRILILHHLSVMHFQEDSFIEVAFFGGSFTGIPIQHQNELLDCVGEFIQTKQVHGIRFSTRPDYITQEIVEMMKAKGVTTIELGIQSFDDEVLLETKRGYNSSVGEKSCQLILEAGIKLGIQLMIGLPKDNLFKTIYSVNRAIAIQPDFLRVYPTVVLKHTLLEQLYEEGLYEPLSLNDAVTWCSLILEALEGTPVQLIRMGLQSSEDIRLGEEIVAGPYHPAFRQLAESRRIFMWIQSQITSDITHLQIKCPKDSISAVIGQKRSNLIALKINNPTCHFDIVQDNDLRKHHIEICSVQNIGNSREENVIGTLDFC